MSGPPRPRHSTPPRDRSAAAPRDRSTAAPSPRRMIWIAGSVLAGAILSVWLVFTLLPRWLHTSPPPPSNKPAAPAPVDGRRIRATLYYVSDSGDNLIGVDREVPYAATPADQAREILDAEFAPAPDGLLSPIPAGVTVRDVFLTGHGDAYVDLSPEIVTGHPGGSLNEALTVFAIVNAVTTNLRTVTAVQILVDDKQVDTLAGHLDMRRPLKQAPQWIRKDVKGP